MSDSRALPRRRKKAERTLRSEPVVEAEPSVTALVGHFLSYPYRQVVPQTCVVLASSMLPKRRSSSTEIELERRAQFREIKND